MKALLLTFSILLALSARSQTVYETKDEAKTKIVNDVYTASNGQKIAVGDTVRLGKGTMPDKRFAFIYELPNLLTYNQYVDYTQAKLPMTYNNRNAVIADLIVYGTKKTGFYIVAKLKVGTMSRYVADIENAIEVGEIAAKKVEKSSE